MTVLSPQPRYDYLSVSTVKLTICTVYSCRFYFWRISWSYDTLPKPDALWSTQRSSSTTTTKTV